MTIRGLGKPTPVQLYLLQLAGMVIQGRRGPIDNPTDEQISQSKIEGLNELKQMTGMDFGYDVMKWYSYLVHSDYGLTHVYGYKMTKAKLREMGYPVPDKKDVTNSELVDNGE